MVPRLTLLYTIFDRNGIFRIPSVDKCYPFHIPCLELCIDPFKLTAVNALFLKHEYTMHTRTFS